MCKDKLVMQVVQVSLAPEAADQLSKRAYDRTVDWMCHWTPRGNFPAVIAGSKEEGLDMCRDVLKEALVPPWLEAESSVGPQHFTFRVAYADVNDGKFWPKLDCVWVEDHRVFV